MASTDDELLPQQVLLDFRDDVEAFKKKLSQPDAKATELMLQIESLKDSIHELTVIFQKALEQTKEENLTVLLKTMSERLEAIVSQNETIAKGMIAISDKLENFMGRQSGVSAAAYSPGMLSGMPPGMPAGGQMMGSPPGLQGPRVAPMPLMEGFDSGMVTGSRGASGGPEMPPPPPGKKRLGLFK